MKNEIKEQRLVERNKKLPEQIRAVKAQRTKDAGYVAAAIALQVELYQQMIGQLGSKNTTEKIAYNCAIHALLNLSDRLEYLLDAYRPVDAKRARFLIDQK